MDEEELRPAELGADVEVDCEQVERLSRHLDVRVRLGGGGGGGSWVAGLG